MKLAGKWVGFYEYGQGYQPPSFGERVVVEFIIEDQEDGFEGSCREEASAYSIDEISKITGFTENGMISFTKTYQNTYQIQDDQQVIIVSGKEMQVNYYGEYTPKGDCIYGLWEVESEEFELDGELVQTVSSGIWKLTKDVKINKH